VHSPNLARLKSSVKVVRHMGGLWKAVEKGEAGLSARRCGEARPKDFVALTRKLGSEFLFGERALRLLAFENVAGRVAPCPLRNEALCRVEKVLKVVLALFSVQGLAQKGLRVGFP
jgi:hypothetical protein